MVVYFWKENEKPYGVFCQWYMKQFTDDDKYCYCCTEQYMMAHKALLFEGVSSPMCEKIMNCTSADLIKKLGRQIKNFDQKVWDAKKYDIVLRANRYKFRDPILKKILLDTKNEEIAEASPYDKVWGIGYNTTNADINRQHWGENLLGKVLMQVRSELK